MADYRGRVKANWPNRDEEEDIRTAEEYWLEDLHDEQDSMYEEWCDDLLLYLEEMGYWD